MQSVLSLAIVLFNRAYFCLMEGVGKIKEKKKKRFEMVITSNVVCVRERGVNVMVKGKAIFAHGNRESDQRL